MERLIGAAAYLTETPHLSAAQKGAQRVRTTVVVALGFGFGVNYALSVLRKTEHLFWLFLYPSVYRLLFKIRVHPR